MLGVMSIGTTLSGKSGFGPLRASVYIYLWYICIYI